MAKNIPGGSSTTRSFPASLGPTAAPDLWIVDYEVDFTDPAHAHDFLGGTNTKSMGGVTWTANSDSLAEATTLATEDGVGLKMVPVEASDFSNIISGGAQTGDACPILTATVAGAGNLSPTATNSSVLAIQAEGSVTSGSGDVAANYDTYSLVASTSDFVNYALCKRIWLSAKKADMQMPTGTNSHVTLRESVATTPTFLEMMIFPGGGGQSSFSSSAYPDNPMRGTVWNAPFDYDAKNADASSITFRPANLVAGMLAHRGGAGTTGFTVVWTKFRVLRLDVS